MENLKKFLKCLDTYYIQFLVSIESFANYLDIRHNRHEEVEQLRSIQRQIYDKHFKEFVQSCQSNVANVLSMLVRKFDAPLKLIEKRRDKRIDYESNLKSNKSGSNLDQFKNVFEGLNRQLIEELPMLTEASLKIFQLCVQSFTANYKKLNGMITKLYLDNLGRLPVVMNSPFGKRFEVDARIGCDKNFPFRILR